MNVGCQVRTLVGHTGQVTRVQFSDDSKQIISAGRGDHTVRGFWHEALPRGHVWVVNICFGVRK
jgi:WD40 repeat protein